MAEKRKPKTSTAVQKAPAKRTAQARRQSVQVESTVVQGAGGIAQSWSIWSFMGAMDECPPYWSRSRDKWLREFVYRPGNDLLAGVMATAVNKVTATGFVLEGPERTVNLYRDIILRKSEFGAGYAKMIGKDAFDFFSQDAGAYRERIRTSPTDTSGGALGFAHFDSQRCFLTGQSEFPVEYVDVTGVVHKLHFSQVQQYTDLPSPQETMYGVGFCSVSRAITTAHILVDIARYKRERLSDLPPAGILLLNNLEKSKWQDMEKQYSADERNKNNTVWRNVMVAFGMDPAVPATAELFEFSRLPEHFNEPEAIRIAVLSLALAFNMDVNEIWSVLAGQMGSGKESDVQHMKAKGKGPGAFLTETERGWNDGLSLPPGIVFRYDFADAEEDQLAAQIADTKAATIRKLWEPSSATGAGIITTDEARQWLQLEGLVTDELMAQGVMADESTADDVEAAKSMIRVDDSPRCKAYSDGRVVRIERRSMSWLGVSLSAAKKDNVSKFNPNHEPAGSSTGGQFADGGGGGAAGDVGGNGGGDSTSFSNAKEFKKSGDARDFGRAHSTPPDDPDEYDEYAGAVQKFTDEGYKYINGELRDGKSLSEMSPQARRIARDMDKYMSPVDSDILVYRSVSKLPDVKPGDLVQDKGFVSTTLFEPVLDNVTALKDKPRVRIFVGKGKKGFYPGQEGAYAEEEIEFVLPRGSMFKVVKIDRENGTMDLVMR